MTPWFRTNLADVIEDWLDGEEPVSELVQEIVDLVVEVYGPPF